MFFSCDYNSHMIWNDLFTHGRIELCLPAPFCVMTGLTSRYSVNVTCGSLNYISLMQAPFMRREHEHERKKYNFGQKFQNVLHDSSLLLYYSIQISLNKKVFLHCLQNFGHLMSISYL